MGSQINPLTLDHLPSNILDTYSSSSNMYHSLTPTPTNSLGSHSNQPLAINIPTHHPPNILWHLPSNTLIITHLHINNTPTSITPHDLSPITHQHHTYLSHHHPPNILWHLPSNTLIITHLHHTQHHDTITWIITHTQQHTNTSNHPPDHLPITLWSLTDTHQS